MTGLRALHFGYVSAIGRREREIIRAHAGRIDNPYNYCREASLDLSDELRSNGFSARVLCCSGLKPAAPEADARWLDLAPQSCWVHFLVKIGEDIVDLTRRQFFPRSAFPYLQSLSACDAEWVNVSLTRPQVKPLLPV